MTSKDIKDRINNEIEKIPDDILENVLEYLKSLTSRSKSEIQMSQNLSKILEEDKNLLEKLAQ